MVGVGCHWASCGICHIEYVSFSTFTITYLLDWPSEDRWQRLAVRITKGPHTDPDNSRDGLLSGFPFMPTLNSILNPFQKK